MAAKYIFYGKFDEKCKLVVFPPKFEFSLLARLNYPSKVVWNCPFKLLYPELILHINKKVQI